MEYGITSIIPPLTAIFLAIITRQVILSLFTGIFIGQIILAGGNLLIGLRNTIEGLVDVFKDGSNTKVIMYCLLVGSVILLIQKTGGVSAFVKYISVRKIADTKRKAGLLSFTLGLIIWIESSITSLVVGTVSRPLYDKLKISREKLAYICDSTSAPICILIPLNGWGAYIIGILANEGIKNNIDVFISSIFLNFYAIISIVLVLFFIIFQKDFFSMRKAEERVKKTGKLMNDQSRPVVSNEITLAEPKPEIKHRSINMFLPLAVMVFMMPTALLITGDGNLTNGSGSTSVLWAVMTSLFVAAVYYFITNSLTIKEFLDETLKGIGGLIPLAIIMLLAFATGDICKELNTAEYVSSTISYSIDKIFVVPLIFVTTAFISFSTGTSWGTFSIMIPIALPLSAAFNIDQSLILSAVLGGGIFGDHASPISDTTIISSMASACDHIDHVKTQLPYAAISFGITILIYFLVMLI